MKKTLQWVFFFVCVALFLFLRLHPSSKKEKTSVHKIEKPKLPPPIIMAPEHPWLQIQPKVTHAALEITRDLEKIRQLSTYAPGYSEEDLTGLLMEKLLLVQASIPFKFPEHLYNVLCITDSKGETPAPFQIFKRLYLGETDLGMPFYLDVRVFELSACDPEEILKWHLNILEGPSEEVAASPQRKSFLCHGKRKENDSTHGFATLQVERGLFLDFYQKGDKLYVCYAEAPLHTFKQHVTLLRGFAGK